MQPFQSRDKRIETYVNHVTFSSVMFMNQYITIQIKKHKTTSYGYKAVNLSSWGVFYNVLQCNYNLLSCRLDTIMDSDRVLVMDRGTVLECDSPRVLLGNKRSFFYGLVHSTKTGKS